MLVTVLLAVLLWSLHARLRRQQFNRWWAAAWTLAAIHLGIGRLALAFPPAWSLEKRVLLTVEEYQRSEGELVESDNHRLRTAELNTTLQAEIRRRHEIEQELRASEDRYRDLRTHSGF